MIFVRETSDPLTSLVKKIDQRLEEAAGKLPPGRHFGVFVIFDSKAKELAEELRAIAEKQAVKRVSLCIGTPPQTYEVSDEAALTAVTYIRGKVVANTALRKGQLDETQRNVIVEAVSSALPK